MRSPAPLTIISALLICSAFCQSAVSQTTTPRKNPDATVSGKVTIKGKPAPDIVVGLRSSEPEESNPTFKATTDQDGNYRIINVPAGSYEIAPVAPALVFADVNTAGGQTLVITEGEHVERTNFELVRGGVITGKITDADGHPLIEESVNLLPVDPSSNRGPLFPVSFRFQTDDRGIYRIFGVRPGRYKVSVGERNSDFFRGRGRQAFPITFYPDVTDPAKAAVVGIQEGTEASGIDITLGPSLEGFTVSGRIVNGETGKPVADMAIGLSRIVIVNANSTSSYGTATGVRSDNRGEFRLQKLPPGKYAISVYPPPDSDLQADAVPFDVTDQDVTGLLIKTATGTSLSGTVVVEGTTDKSVLSALAQSYLSANLRNESLNSSSGRSVQIMPDGTFRVGGLSAGIAYLSLGGPISRLSVSRVEVNGVIQAKGIEVKNGEQITGIRVVVAFHNGGIRGIVKLENGTLPPSAHLVLQLKKAEDPAANTQSSNADSRGHFLIEGLAAGNYELTVFAFASEWKQRSVTTKQLVTVTEGALTDLTVTLDLASITVP